MMCVSNISYRVGVCMHKQSHRQTNTYIWNRVYLHLTNDEWEEQKKKNDIFADIGTNKQRTTATARMEEKSDGEKPESKAVENHFIMLYFRCGVGIGARPMELWWWRSTAKWTVRATRHDYLTSDMSKRIQCLGLFSAMRFPPAAIYCCHRWIFFFLLFNLTFWGRDFFWLEREMIPESTPDTRKNKYRKIEMIRDIMTRHQPIIWSI